MRSSGGRGDLGPDCELTVILLVEVLAVMARWWGLEGLLLVVVLPPFVVQLSGAALCKIKTLKITYIKRKLQSLLRYFTSSTKKYYRMINLFEFRHKNNNMES